MDMILMMITGSIIGFTLGRLAWYLSQKHHDPQHKQE